MTGYIGKTTNGMREVVGSQAQAEREDLFGPINGEIVGYDAAAGTIDVQPLGTKLLGNGKELTYPVLYDVPLEQTRSGNSGLTFPAPVGSRVRLTPQMRSTENYHRDGSGKPSDTRSFHLADMTASLTGGNSLSDPMKNVDPDNTHLRFSDDGKFGIRGSPDGKIAIEGAQGDVYGLLAQVIRLIAEDGLEIRYGSSRGTGHALANKEAILDIVSKLEAMKLK